MSDAVGLEEPGGVGVAGQNHEDIALCVVEVLKYMGVSTDKKVFILELIGSGLTGKGLKPVDLEDYVAMSLVRALYSSLHRLSVGGVERSLNMDSFKGSLIINRSIYERDALGTFVRSRLALGEKDADEGDKWMKMFDEISHVSNVKYEGSECCGTMVFTRTDCEVLIRFEDRMELSNYKYVRKLLEGCRFGREVCLVVDSVSQSIIGYENVESVDDPLCLVSILGQGVWELWLKGRLEVRMRHRELDFRRDTALWKQHMCKALKLLDYRGSVKAVENLVDRVISTKGGSMIVISCDAEKEVSRLSTQGTVTKPVSIRHNTGVIASLSKIDGALVIGVEGMLYGFGMMLDGVLIEGGDSSRGARYNSAIKYSHDKRCVVLILSEDGYVDVVYNGKRM